MKRYDFYNQKKKFVTIFTYHMTLRIKSIKDAQ